MKRALLLVALLVPSWAPATTPDAHCYKLHMSPWSPAMRLGGDEVFTTVPESFELTNNLQRTIVGEREEFAIAPALGAKASIHRRAYWFPENGRIKLVWTNGFSGVSMDLKPEGKSLKGSAHTFWDFDRPTQSSSVTASEVSCVASGG